MSSELDKLRAEYRKVRANVGSKINRVKKATGANVAGSSYDPRYKVKDGRKILTPTGHEKRLNAVQLRSAIAKMNDFNRKNVQFIALQGGAPISKTHWAPLQSKINIRNIKQQKFAKEIDSQRFPGMYESATQHQAKTVEKADGGAIGPFDIVGNEPSQYTSLSAIKQMEKKINKELKPDFRDKKLKIARQQLEMAMLMMGESKEDIDRIAELNDFQFNLIWYDSPIPEAAFLKYGSWLAIEAGNPKDWQLNNMESSELHELIAETRRDDFPTGPKIEPRQRQTKKTGRPKKR